MQIPIQDHTILGEDNNTITSNDNAVTEVAAPNAEIQTYVDKLKKLEATQERYKQINAAYRAWKKKPESLDANKILSDADKTLIRTWVPRYSYQNAPIETYMMTNNNAVIKNTKERIATLTRKHNETLKTDGENVEYPFNGGVVVLNYTEDRVQLVYDDKPNEATITDLKQRGFKWSPSNKAWQRMITDNTIYAVKSLLGVSIPYLGR